MLRYIVTAALVLVVALSPILAAGPAQTVLQDLAETERSERMFSGYVLVGAGVIVGAAASLILASAIGSDDPLVALIGVGIGAVFVVPGILSLTIPSRAEREYAVSGGAEDRSVVALQRLASKGRSERYVSGIANAAIAVASLLSPFYFASSYDYLYATAFYGGMAAYRFLFPSREEEALQRYYALAAAARAQ